MNLTINEQANIHAALIERSQSLGRLAQATTASASVMEGERAIKCLESAKTHLKNSIECRKLSTLPFYTSARKPINIPKLPKGAQTAGGHARAAKLSPQRRSEIARAAAVARWGKDANE